MCICTHSPPIACTAILFCKISDCPWAPMIRGCRNYCATVQDNECPTETPKLPTETPSTISLHHYLLVLCLGSPIYIITLASSTAMSRFSHTFISLTSWRPIDQLYCFTFGLV